MTVLALVPARGGSVGVPRKNLAEVNGRSLVARAVDAAHAAASVDRVVVSTDDDEIATAAAAAGAEVLRRPASISGSETGAVEVIVHALDVLREDPEALVYLQPTSPFRTARHVDDAVALLRAGADAVVSVAPVPHAHTPGSLLAVDDEGFVAPATAAGGALRRQDKPSLLARNGPAVLVVRPRIVRSGTLYPPRTRPLVMGKLESLDVDDEDDLVLVRAIAPLLDDRG